MFLQVPRLCGHSSSILSMKAMRGHHKSLSSRALQEFPSLLEDPLRGKLLCHLFPSWLGHTCNAQSCFSHLVRDSHGEEMSGTEAGKEGRK